MYLVQVLMDSVDQKSSISLQTSCAKWISFLAKSINSIISVHGEINWLMPYYISLINIAYSETSCLWALGGY